MKILVIPDIHGKFDDAFSVINEHKDHVDKVVVLGDYVDGYEQGLDNDSLVNDFWMLCEMARKEPDKFCLCLGNHDMSYISSGRDAIYCSRHHGDMANYYREMFRDNLDILNVVYLIDGCLFSHAGVTMDFYKRVVKSFEENHCHYKLTTDDINKLDVCAEITYQRYNKDCSLERIAQLKLKGEYWSESELYYNKLKKRYCADLKPLNLIHNSFDVETLNKIMHYDTNCCESPYNGISFYDLEWCDYRGDKTDASCVWIRPWALFRAKKWPPRIKYQVVGHTRIGLGAFKSGSRRLIVVDSNNDKERKGALLDTTLIDEIPWKEVTHRGRKKPQNIDEWLEAFLK